MTLEEEVEQFKKKVRMRKPEMKWIIILNPHQAMDQRYLHNVADARVAHHIERGWEDGLLVSSVASCQNLWTLILDSGTGFTSQVYKLSPGFLDEEEILKEWIEEHRKKNYRITAMAGHDYGSSLVVMSKGTKYGQQCYDCSYSFPFDWIKEKWREGFYVTSMATNGMEWRVVMSQGAGFSDQVVELDFLYPSEGIHRRWSCGFCITATAAN
ncbi:hypothetical protein RHGRI_031251 [Rhododendron griersonianum]|uniref:DUF7477 domain-containing protein n=1 Tax=Rhododendron griersonianum TaxID=479676 RepID=A0AAV6ID36_9ERIC|nr:hypothetical protein RHGRI_031251 [Rhododendron griersonianum]